MSTAEVFQTIRDDGQQPQYAAGNESLSCVLRIMGSKNDLRNGAKARPELFARYVELERRTGYTFFHKQSLADLVKEAEKLAA